MNDVRPLATIGEVSAYLRVPVATLYDWRHHRKGPKARRVGRHLRYDWADVEAYNEDTPQSTGGSAA